MRPFFFAFFLVVFPVGTVGGYQHAVSSQQAAKGQQNLMLDQQRVLDERYYYNVDSGQCEQFTYDGCSDGLNNFDTKKECKKACHVKSVKSVYHYHP
ncbi:Kunitz/Bovine pancreatic trypsin inhibitor domain protein [Ancylostoma duodenale]|uniref:Kunitz/Bovine pancreatic trypsin inhibitor domain protein n=1 Tax=Ancylostoma duodenale TaxID=51022 RepID=A0A0C2CSM9_9BILA|nr:Kunitz/Bovine pancreatic trypsin inhibitor domain protein [Ancylostoma duodenale]